MKTRDRENLLKLTAIVAVALLAGDSLVIQPLSARWKETSDQITELREKLERGTQLVDRERSIRRSWRIFQRDDLDENRSLAENQVLKAMETWMADSGIRLTAAKPQWQDFDNRFSTYNIRLTAEGDIRQCVTFVHLIEKDPLPVRVEEIEYASRDKDGKNLAITMSISGVQFGENLQQ
jgi:hypothetical protein